jgi:predicted XRE-type DNA-binding protein
MKSNRFDSVWDAIEDGPQEAENMKLRAQLMRAIVDRIERKKLSQVEAARILGVSQPRVSDLMRGKIDKFALDILVNMAMALGIRVKLQITSKAA